MSFMQTEPFEGVLVREQRKHRLLRGVIRSQEIGDQEVLIRNLSRRGLGGKALGSPLKIGAKVEVIIRGEIALAATVRWTKCNSFGLKFCHEIDDEVIVAWLQQEFSRPSDGQWEVRTRHRVYRSTSGAPVRRL